MKRKIFKKMCLLATGIIVLISLLILYLFNNVLNGQMERKVKAEALNAANTLNLLRDETGFSSKYMDTFKDVEDTRLTLIDAAGNVQYDSAGDPRLMENHLQRPEVQTAVEQGIGSEIRFSQTLKEKHIYYAVLLDSGEVLRLSYVYKSVFALFFESLPMLLGIYILAIVITLLIAVKMTNDIIEPVNNIDLQMPDKNVPYEELKPLLDRISKQNESRQKNEKMRREFSANVSHELKTPLTSISGYAELMQSGLVKSEDVVMFSGKIYKEAGRLINLVNDIIKISGLDERKIGIEKETVDLMQIALDVKERLDILAAKNKITIQVTGQQIMTEAVPQMIDELIFNLCENAMKYNNSGGKVTIKISDDNGRARIEVKDTGIGIPKAHQARIFERFYRVDKSHSRQTGGTGLGLAIVKHVVEYHEGEILLSSSEGQGTKIVVLL